DAPNAFVGTGRSTEIALIPPSPDFYSFHLDAGQSATVGVKALASISGLVLQIQDESGNLLAQSAGGTSRFDSPISDFVAPHSGTYYAVTSGQSMGDYSLVVTRSAVFDTEPNNSVATAQPLPETAADGSHSVLGYLEPAHSPLYTTGNDGTQLITINTST